MQQLSGKNIMITGAGSGIGEAIACGLAAEGARIGVSDINFEAAVAVVNRIQASGGQAHAIQVDVTVRESIAKGIREFTDRFGQLQIMINNAGISAEKPFLEVVEKDWNSLMTVNGLGVLLCMQESAKVFIAQGGGGRIINTTSITAKNATANFAPYAASKAAVSSLIQSGARALADHGIRVTGFAPGIVDTELWSGIHSDVERRQAKLETYAEGILVGRVAVPADLVPAVIFLATDGADYITGQVLTVDGGMVLS